MAFRIKKIEQVAGLVGKVFNNMALDSDVDAPSINAVKNAFSNPNLLINGDFRINQRGNSTYSHSSETRLYTIDRWCLYSNPSTTATLTLLEQGIKFSVTGQKADLFQPLENRLNIGNYTLTFKINSINPTTNGTGINKIGYYNGSSIITKDVTNTGIIEFNIENDYVERIYICGEINSHIDIEWIKLEQGLIATSFVPRLYDEEISMCKRYYQLVKTNGVIGYEYGSSGNYFYMIGFDFEEMRTTPSISYMKCGYNTSDGAYLSTEGIYSTITSAPTKYVFKSNPYAYRPHQYCYFADVSAILNAEIY